MKYFLLFCFVLTGPFTKGNQTKLPNPMAVYAGRYSMTSENDKTGYIKISPKGNNLVLHEEWSGDNIDLKHLSGDNFLMGVKAWAAHFNRDKTKAVVSVEIRGADLWTKVK